MRRGDLVGSGVVTVAALLVLASMRFHLCLNDFWAWSFLAARMSWADPATWYNGFMPPAYALFIKAVGPAREIPAAFVMTLLSVALTTFTTMRLAREQAVPGAPLLAAVLLALFAPFLASGLTAGPDIVVAALVSGSLLLRGERSAFAGGALLGLALLVRSHALVAGLAIVIALAITGSRAVAVRLVPGIVAAISVQVAVNLAAGQSAWSSAQAFNVYKMVHGMDWYAPVVPADLSLLQIAREQPVAFAREWAGAMARAGIWFAGPALAWVYARGRGLVALRSGAAFATLAGILYVVPVSLGDSPRATVVLSALVVAPVAGLILDLRRQPRNAAGLAVVVVLALGISLSIRSDRAFLQHNFRQTGDFAALERALRERGVDRAREVFTDDFDLYFRGIEGRRPLTKGGWGVIGISGWTDEFPQLPVGDLSAFLESCREHGVRYLALTRRCRRIGPGFSHTYYDPTAVGLEALGEYGEFRLVGVPRSGPPPEEIGQ